MSQMKKLCILIFALQVALISRAEQIEVRYSMQQIHGRMLVAYRVAALAYFKVQDIEDCESKLDSYDVAFTELGDEIRISFLTPHIDHNRDQNDKQAIVREMEKAFTITGSTVVVDSKTMKVVRIFPCN